MLCDVQSKIRGLMIFDSVPLKTRVNFVLFNCISYGRLPPGFFFFFDTRLAVKQKLRDLFLLKEKK